MSNSDIKLYETFVAMIKIAMAQKCPHSSFQNSYIGYSHRSPIAISFLLEDGSPLVIGSSTTELRQNEFPKRAFVDLVNARVNMALSAVKAAA